MKNSSYIYKKWLAVSEVTIHQNRPAINALTENLTPPWLQSTIKDGENRKKQQVR